MAIQLSRVPLEPRRFLAAIEYIVPLAEAYDSGLRESQFETIAGDLVNLTIADPTVNRPEKSDRDAAEWRPSRNTGWFAAKVVAVPGDCEGS